MESLRGDTSLLFDGGAEVFEAKEAAPRFAHPKSARGALQHPQLPWEANGGDALGGTRESVSAGDEGGDELDNLLDNFVRREGKWRR